MRAFPVGKELADTIVLGAAEEELTLLCSQVRPENGLYTRYRRYVLRPDPQEEGGFALEEDEPFGLEHRFYDLGARNAGPLFCWGGQTVRPAQVSTKVDYGVYLQFWTRRGGKETPLCAATPQNVTISGLDPAAVIGIHTYCRDEELEVIERALSHAAEINLFDRKGGLSMLTIAIPQLYCGASGKRGAYNRQEVGLARAFAALGCRAVVLYPAPGAAAPETECPAPGVKVLYLPARAWRVNAFYQSWQPLLE